MTDEFLGMILFDIYNQYRLNVEYMHLFEVVRQYGADVLSIINGEETF